MPQAFAELELTNPAGNVRVIFPVLAATFVTVVKDTVHACPVPWPRRPCREGLDTHLVQGVST